MRAADKIFVSVLLFCGLNVSLVFAQTTKVTGTIKDALTFEPVPFATVTFKGTNTAVSSDINGNFTIETTGNADTLTASFVGYISIVLHIVPHRTQVVDLVLGVNKVDLPEAVIVPGENPAIVLLRKVIENKPHNDREKLEAFQYEAYNKVEFDISNLTEKFKKQKVLKPFAFIFDYVDTTPTNKVPFLPVFISENLSDFYFRKNPAAQKEVIKASKLSGVENATITQFLGDMYQGTNVYANYINVFGKNFVSPIANVGQFYYKYYLIDSAFFGNKWCYKISYKPRRKQELTFQGDFWVSDTTFAIKKISARIAPDANINFVEDLAVVQEFDYINEEQWMLTKDILVVDFKEPSGGMSFIGRKTATYKDFILNKPKSSEFFLKTDNIVVEDSAALHSEAYWNSMRHDSLSLREKKIYSMVDSMQSLPAFKTWVDLITLFVSGYYEIGLFELGPYFTFLSFNQVEGARFRLGGRTGNKFSTSLILSGFGAYGLRDHKFKYMGGAQYFLSKKPRNSVGLSYVSDVEQLGLSENAFQEDNILASLFRRGRAHKLTDIQETKAFYEYEWYPGFSSRVTFSHRFFNPIAPLDYSYFPEFPDSSSIRNTLNTSEINFYTRFAYRERFIAGKVDRISLGTKYPTLQFGFTVGLKGTLGSDFTYEKLNMKISHFFYIGSTGWTEYIAEVGKTWGRLPYPLLTIHQGNESYSYDYLAFNLMNYYEFVSDQYASVFLTHHFGGLLLNHIPLMKKLRWRELATAKALVGELEQRNIDLLIDKNSFSTLKKPYVEVGTGIENIFRIFRVDAIWRLSYVDKKYLDNYYLHNTVNKISTFGIRGSLQVSF